ncbi:MAG: TOBE domain-containing protein [Thermoplasmata archaeon]
MKLSARNVIKGKIKKITYGLVDAEVIVELHGKTKIVSVITKESAKRLGLKKGKDAYAIIKSSNVIIGVD